MLTIPKPTLASDSSCKTRTHTGMETNNDDCVESYNFRVITKNPFIKVGIVWEIENFNHYDSSSVLLSPELVLPGFTWQFGLRNKPGTKLAEILIRTSCDDSMFVSGRINYDSKHFFVHKNISKGDNAISGDLLLLSGNFSVDLEVYNSNKRSFFSDEISNENSLSSSPSDNYLRTKHLLDKIKVMWESETTDIRILVEEKTIPAHKFVLLAMSPVLASKIRQTTEEENTVPISDTSFKAMELIVKSLYGLFPDVEALMEEWDELCHLYEACDHYEALDLRDVCARAMVKMLTVENAGQLMHLSDRYEDDSLLNDVLSFCYKNFEEVSDTDEWKTWLIKNPTLASYVKLATYRLKRVADTNK